MAVLVTGANGYIAQHIVSKLLNQGHQVIGTVRAEYKAKRLEGSFENNGNLILEIVPDIAAPNAFDRIFEKHMEEIEIVIHTASAVPVPTSSCYRRSFTAPAIKGTKNILNAIRKYGDGKVRHLVLTSTGGTAIDPFKVGDSNVKFTEKDWNPITLDQADANMYFAYMAGKKYAELEAWAFSKENICKVTTILPFFIFGPWRFDDYAKGGLTPSNETIESIVHSSKGEALTPEWRSQFIDVRDVAIAHLLAFQKEHISGHRLSLSSGKFTPQRIADILNARFPQLQDKISKGPRPGDPDMNIGAEFVTTESDKILSIKYKGLEESVYDTAAQLLKVEGRL